MIYPFNTYTRTAITTIVIMCFVWTSSSICGDAVSKPYWIFFKDKGLKDDISLNSALSEYKGSLPAKAVQRRNKSMSTDIVDVRDLPVNEDYLDRVGSIDGVIARHVSRWLNAISANLDDNALREIKQLPFVVKLQPVRSFTRTSEDALREEFQPDDNPPARDYNLEYGLSLRQNEFLNIPELHDLGYFGGGVVVGLLDAGFNNLDHDCFQELDLLDSWDFVNNDDNVGDEDDFGSGSHGTKTLSIIAGYDPGRMIGGAFEATYILAKTENTELEARVEEDHWVAGIEWMDELGVEVVSSSLSYFEWYDYEDLDGSHGVTTLIADRAVEVGIVVVSAMGNSGRGRYPLNKMGTPADGFNVLSIGAVNQDSTYAGWSSQGPTYDGRIKPDFTTFGSSVRFASAMVDDQYGAGAGTSFSTPALAGLCALLIQVNPYLTPNSLRDLLRRISNNSEEPDTLLGWGIPDGLAAWREGGLNAVELVISMQEGWNTVSHNLHGGALDIVLIMEPLNELGILVLVKDGWGRIYYPLMNFIDIPFWNHWEGYQVQLNEDADLTFEGDLMPYNVPIELEEGWQIVTYLPNFPMDAETAFESLVTDDLLIIVKNDHGRFYYPEFGFSNMPLCRPGKGYHIKLRDEGSLVYPRQRLLDHAGGGFELPVHFPVVQPGGANMSVLLLGDNNIDDGDEVACFDGNGKLLGSGVFMDGKCGLAAWGEQSETEVLRFKLFRKNHNRIFDPKLEPIRVSSVYHRNYISVFNVSVPNAAFTDELGLDFKISPNPFNSYFEIHFSSAHEKEVDVSIYNLEGRRIAFRSVNGFSQDRIAFNTSGWSSGCYIIRLENRDLKAERLIQLLK